MQSQIVVYENDENVELTDAVACVMFAAVWRLVRCSRAVVTTSHTHTADWRPYNGPFGWRRFRPIIRCYQWQSNSLEWFIVTRRRRAIVQTTATADALPPPPPPVVRSVAIKRLPSLYAHHSLSDSGCVTLLRPLQSTAGIAVSLNYGRSYVTLCVT